MPKLCWMFLSSYFLLLINCFMRVLIIFSMTFVQRVYKSKCYSECSPQMLTKLIVQLWILMELLDTDADRVNLQSPLFTYPLSYGLLQTFSVMSQRQSTCADVLRMSHISDENSLHNLCCCNQHLLEIAHPVVSDKESKLCFSLNPWFETYSENFCCTLWT